jgi:hypothetical protein
MICIIDYFKIVFFVAIFNFIFLLEYGHPSQDNFINNTKLVNLSERDKTITC